MKHKLLVRSLFFYFLFLFTIEVDGKTYLTRLQVDYLSAPIGIDDFQPRFSWELSADKMYQYAYRIIVGTDSSAVNRNIGSIWDSKYQTDFHQITTYKGGKLTPFTSYYWRVIVLINKNHKQISSSVQRFSTGMFKSVDWKGTWITDGHDKDFLPAPYFRKTFVQEKHTLKAATVYIVTAGLFKLYINGQLIGDHFLDPAFTHYDRKCLYEAFDVTSRLRTGQNVLGVVLGNGWYNFQAKAVWNFDKAPWRNRPAFQLNLRLEYTDGTANTIFTDGTWKTATGPLVYDSIYTGDHYDFRLSDRNWNRVEYNDRNWVPAVVCRAVTSVVKKQSMVPIRLVKKFDVVSMHRINSRDYLFDFGQNMSGITELNICGEKGTEVRIKHGERVDSAGHLNQSNIDIYYRGDKNSEPFQTDVIWLDGKEDHFKANFSYKGFRYVEITSNLPIELHKDALKAYFVHSDVQEVGQIKTSCPLLNKLFRATNYSYLSNLMGYPTDCPQREKNGWTGDGSIAVETGLYSYNGITVYEKWLADHQDEQLSNGVLPDIIPTDGWGFGTENGLDWTSSIAIIPWNLYLFYGDIRPLTNCYDNIKRYLDYAISTCENYLTSWGRGDWVPVNTTSTKELTCSIYLYTDAIILSKVASLLGKTLDSQHYSLLANTIKNAINNKYFNSKNSIYANGTMTELAMPLQWGIVPENKRNSVASQLALLVRAKGYHLDVGILGAKAVLNALSENGYADDAYRLAIQDTYPSLGYWIKNGATTLQENWKLNQVRDASDNHIMFGELNAWMYKGLGGIFPDEKDPGFHHIILRPNFINSLHFFRASHHSIYGEIISKWYWKGRYVIYEANIPSNSYATFYLPICFKRSKKIDLPSGKYKIILNMKKKNVFRITEL
jgi:alpha-L-rhamnosidase